MYPSAGINFDPRQMQNMATIPQGPTHCMNQQGNAFIRPAGNMYMPRHIGMPNVQGVQGMAPVGRFDNVTMNVANRNQQQMQSAMMPQMPAGMITQNMMPGMAPYPNVQPPGYTKEMAQHYEAKQKTMKSKQMKSVEEQRRLYEQTLKKQAFQEQQKKLKEFNNISGRKINADAMIQHIVGPTITTNQKHGKVSTIEQPEEDGFGDFIQGPSCENDGDQFKTQPITSMQAEINNKQETVSAQPNIPIPPAKEISKTKDLTSMMMECSDFNAPAKAKTFTKKSSVKDIKVSAKKSSSFNESQKARNWNSGPNDLSDVFVLPEQPQINHMSNGPDLMTDVTSNQVAPQINNTSLQSVQQPLPASNQTPQVTPVVPQSTQPTLPTTASSSMSTQPVEASVPNQSNSNHKLKETAQSQQGLPPGLPPWCESGFTGSMPPVYEQVLEASMKDNKLDTALVYGILIRSGLPRPILGNLWNLANKTTPGILEKNELYILLALIAVVQNQIPFESISILKRCQQPPIPYLGQPTGPPQPASSNETPSGAGSASSIQSSTDSVQQQPANVNLPQQTLPANVIPPQHEALTANATPVQQQTLTNFPPPQDQILTQNNVEQPPNVSQDDDFADFQSAPTPSILPQPALPLTTPSTKLAQVSQKPVTTNIDDDDFADFQQATASFPTQPDNVSSSSTSSTVKKLSELHALVMKTDLYKTPIKPLETPKTPEDLMGELESLDLTKPSSEPVTKSPNNEEEEWTGFAADDKPKTVEPSTNTLIHKEPSVELTPPDVPNDDDWFADIKKSSSTPAFKVEDSESKQQQTAVTEKNTFKDKVSTTTKSVSDDNITSTNKINKPQQKNSKANAMFGRNLDPWNGSDTAPMAGTGMSPLDMLPPDLPDDIPDDDYGSTDQQTFDHFGTFQGFGSVVDSYSHYDDDIGTETIGGTNSGCLDTLGYASRPQTLSTKEKLPDSPEKDSIKSDAMSVQTDTQSIGSSSEFSGWKTQTTNGVDSTITMATPDVQSVSSLDLYSNKNNTVDKASPQDNIQDDKSDSSLEIPQTIPNQNGFKDGKPNNNANNQSSCTTPEFTSTLNNQGPIDASQILRSGTTAPQFGDRYSGLKDAQDVERHISEWQRCLEECDSIIRQAYASINSVEPEIFHEALSCQKTQDYILNVNEVYKVVKRISEAMQANSLSNNEMVELIKGMDSTWVLLQNIVTKNSLKLPPNELDFKFLVLKQGTDDCTVKACGVCLLNVDTVERPLDPKGNLPTTTVNEPTHTLSHGGRQYHAPCANLWVNKVNSILPALKIPELL